MPSISTYARLAPFTIDELVGAANSVLRGRPRLHVAKRTVRYYVGERLLPPPGGSPKFARYGVDHLMRLVAARCLQDMGRSLEECRRQLDGGLTAETVQTLVDGPVEGARPPAPIAAIPMGRTVVRIPLGPRLVLEAEGMTVEEALQTAGEAMEKISQVSRSP